MNYDKLFGPGGCLRHEAMQNYLSGNLAPQEMQQAERHMLDCEFCAEAMEGLEHSKDASRHIAGLNERISAAAGGGRHQQRTFLRYAAAIAVVAAISVVLFSVLKNTTGPEDTMLSENTPAEKQKLPEPAEPAAGKQNIADDTAADFEISVSDEEPVLKSVPANAAKPSAASPSLAELRESRVEDVAAITAGAPAEGREDEKATDSPPGTEQQAASVPPPAAVMDTKEGRAENAPAAKAKRANVREGNRRSDAWAAPAEKPAQEGEVTKREAQYDDELDELLLSQNDSIEDQVFVIVEDMPQFPGGEKAMREYLQKNIRYPDSAQAAGIQGTVYLTFIVRSDGSIDNARILRGADPLLNEEALHVITGMPRWDPGRQRGKAVNVQYTLPVRFRLKE